MNYTANYHLPQWVKEDRIMMDDFNQMCENIDAGLTANARATEKVSQDGGTQNQLLLDRLLRLAYNHYLALQSAAPFPEQVGMFYQNAERDLSTDAGFIFDGARFTGSGTGSFTTETFFSQCCKTISNLVMKKDDPANSKPMEVEICTPMAARVKDFNLPGNFSDNVPNTPAPFLLTLTNQDTGEVEQSFRLDLTKEYASGAVVTDYQPVSLYFNSGNHYLLRIEPVGTPVFTSNLAFKNGLNTQVQGGGNTGKVLSISHTFRERAGSSMGLLILRCRAGGLTGKLTVSWDGKAMEPAYIRPCQNDQALDLREMIYVRRESIPAESTVSINFACGENGNIWFQDWGAILL